MNVSWCIQRGNDVGFKWFNHIMTWALPFLLFVHYHTCIAVTKLGAVKQLTTSESIDAQSAWSPDGTRLAFVSGRSGANEIWVMNPDGTQLERLVACENAGHFASDPCWSPDGKSLIFVSNRAGNMDIWMLDLTTKELVQLTDSPAVDWMPAVSPDGRRIAFVSDRDGQDALWMLDITAGKKLTKLRNGAWDPAWSPDGNRIAFVASADDERGVWIMDLTTRAQVLVLPNGRSPAWSPRGDQLCIVRKVADKAELVLVSPDGSRCKPLPIKGENPSSPAWSPDGRAIAYDAVQGGNRDVFIATLEILRPQVKILFPTPNVRLEGTVAIRATIQVPYGKLSRMSLEYGHGEKPQVWRAIPLKVAEPVKDAVIAEWDTSELSGILTLRLTAWDEENDSSEALVTVSAERTYGVSFVEHSVPPEMLAGDTVPVTLKLRNIGTMTWLPTGRYAVTLTYRWRDSSGAIVFQGPDTRLPRPVNNSEEVTINTNLQAPRIPGSYTVEWDLQHGGAVWFSDEGCEVLRVNVRVVWRYAAQVLSHNAPKEMAPSQVYTVRVRLRNIGASPWNGEGATEKLFIGYHWLDKQGVMLDEQPILTKIEVPVKPGESAEVNARVRAPDVPGEYSLAWDMAVEGPEERILWLSEQGNAFPQVPIVVRVPYAVAYLNHTTPTTMMPGQIYLASLRLRNTGALTWESRGLRAVHIGYKWLDSKGKELPAPLLTTLLPYDVAPGEIVEVAARVQAPSRAGDYILQWDLVRGGNLWFSRMGSPPLRVEVMVQRPIYGVEFQPREHPTRMIAGHELNVQMQLTNRGTLTWSAAGERAVTLSYHWLDSDGKELLDEQPFKTPLPHDVSLGGTVTLNARVRAPRRPGQWTLRWDLHMAGIGWFSEQGAAFLNVPVTVVPEYDYSVISHDTPTELVAGQTYTVHLRIRNRSAFIWRASGEDMVQLGYKWLDEQGEVVELGGLATIPRDTEPDDVLEMEALLRAPKRPGTYTLKWDMVRQGKIWFEEQGVRALTLQVRVK